jgi:isoquinoline 1-oxidoreductase alpha subunit
MAAVALLEEKGDNITEDDLDSLRNICRCGTYFRIREAIRAAAAQMK